METCYPISDARIVQGSSRMNRSAAGSPVLQYIYHMLFWFIALLLLITLPHIAHGAGGDVTWELGDTPQTEKQEAAASAVDSSGNTIITGFSAQTGDDDYYTIKINAAGDTIVWSKAYDKSGGNDYATAVAVDSNDDVIVTGYAFNGTNYDYHTIKYNGSNGNVLWQHTFNASANGHDYATSIAVDSLDNIYVGGNSQDGSGKDDYMILKYASGGVTPLWQKSYNGSANGNDRIKAITAGVDGIAVTGESENSTPDFDSLTAKYGFDSTLVWEKRKTVSGYDKGVAVKMDSLGHVIVAATVYNGSNKDLYIAKYHESSGNIEWEDTVNGGNDEEPAALYVDSSDDVFVTGYKNMGGTGNDIYTAKYDGSAGTQLWDEEYNSSADNSDKGVSIYADNSGSVFVAGDTYDNASSNYNWQTLKYMKSGGTLLWQKSFAGSAGKDDRVAAVGITSSGEPIVGGWSDKWTSGATDYDFYAVKYDPGLINPPSGLSASTISTSQINLSWTDNSSNEDGFKIDRKTGDGGTWSELTTVGANVTTYNNTGLTADTKYYYRVKSYNAGDGDSLYSNEEYAITTVVSFSTPSTTFIYDSPDVSDDYATAIDAGPDNIPVVTGYSFSNSGQFDYYTVKLNKDTLVEVWNDRYDSDQNMGDLAKSIVVDSTNKVVVSGYSNLFSLVSFANSNDIYTIKYPSTGPASDWTKYYDPLGKDDRGVAVNVSVDGSNNYVVIGYGRNASDDDDLFVIKYLNNGTQDWAATPYDGGVSGHDYPTAVTFDSSGNVIVAGYTDNGTDYDYFVRKINGSTGSPIWTDIYNVNGSGSDYTTAIGVDSSDNIYVTGDAVTASGNADFYTIKYDGTNGTRLWEKSFNGTGDGVDEAIALKVDPVNDDVVVAGTTEASGAQNEFHIIRYDSSGNVVWSRTLDRTGDDDIVRAMSMDNSGNIYVGGNTDSGGYTNVLVAQYDSSGSFLRGSEFDGAASNNDVVNSITTNDIGETYVAGYTTNGSGNADYLVFKMAGELQAPNPLTATPSFTSVQLNWSDNTSDEDSFKIERKNGTCASGNPWSLIQTTSANATSYNDTLLNTGTTYCYRIQTYKSDATSRWIEKAATTLVPSAPSSLTATDINTTRIDLSWSDNTTGETGFKIERCEGSGCSDFAEIDTAAANATSYSDISACNGTEYGYRVIAYKTGEWSTVASNTDTATTAGLNDPTLLTATRASEVQINLSWTDNSSDEIGFKIERCTGAGCSDFAQIDTVAANVTAYNDAGLSYETTYNYRVRAYKAATCGWDTGYTNSDEATTTVAAPTGLSASTVSSTQINLSWTDNTSSETGFKIERCTGAGCSSFAQIDTVGSNVTSYNDVSVCENVTYRYRVRAYETGEWDSGYTSEDETATNAKAAPTVFSATRASEVQINLAWTDNTSDETGFKIERCAGAGCSSWAEITTVGANVTTYNDTGLTHETDYNYRVRAYKTASCAWNSAYSNSDNAVTSITVPGSFSATTANTTRINLSWTDNTVSETGFKIERCTGAGCSGFSQIDTVGANATSYSDLSVCENVTYRYRVRANNGVTWDSGYSTEDETATNAKAAPTVLTATRNSEIRIDLSWTDNTNDETGFKIERCEGSGCSGFAEIADVGANVTSYNDTTVTSGLTYNYKVKAYKTATCSWDIESNTDEAEATILAPSDFTATTINTTQIDLGWTDNTVSETGFKIERCEGTGCSSFSQIDTVAADATSYSDISVCENITYRYRVRANKNTDWDSSYSSEQETATNAKAAPTVLDAVRVSEIRIDLSWTDNTDDETGFKIERCAGSGCSSFSEIADIAADSTSYSDTTVTSGTTYNYQVKAYKTATCSWDIASNTDEEEATIWAPTDFTVTMINTSQIDLSWTDNTVSETAFKIERCTGASCGDFSQIDTAAADATSYSDISVCENTTYRYRIRANKDAEWDSGYSTEEETAADAKAAPAGLTDDIQSEFQIDLYWTDNTYDESGYELQRCTDVAANCTADVDFTYSTDVTGDGDVVAYWNMNENSGTEAKDRAGTINGAILGASWTTGKTGTGLSFNGSSDTLVAAGTGALENVTDSDFTFMAWVKPASVPPNTGTDDELYSIIGRPGIHMRMEYNKDQKFGLGIYNSSDTFYGVYTPLTYAPGSWYQVAGVVDDTAKEIHIYVDGDLKNTVSYSGSLKDYGTADYRIGYSAPSGSYTYFYHGDIDEVAVYDRVLTATEVQAANSKNMPFTHKHSDTGLSPGTTYSYRIKGDKTSSCSWDAFTATLETATMAPPAPTDLSVATVDTTQIDLSWTDNTVTEDGFKIERCEGAGCSGFAQIDTVGVDVATYSDITACENTTYRYRVRAYKTSEWDSGYTNEDETATNAKQAPTLLSATRISEVQINLSWTDNANDETGFKIERCAGSGCSDWSEITTVGANVTTYNNTGLTHETDYNYRVRAYKTASCAWDSAYSNSDNAVTTITVPSGLSASTVNTTQIDLSWTDNTVSETGFKIERCEGASCSGFAQIDTVGANATSYSDVSVCENTTYRYRVRANNGVTWDSGYSNEDETATNAKAAPTVFSATRVSEVRIDLSWTDNSADETGFKIERCAGAGCSDWSQIGMVGSNVTTYSNTGLTHETDYNYRVRAYKTASCAWDSAYSNSDNAVTTITVPSGLSASTVNTTQIDLSWTDNTVSETGFKIERCEGASCSGFAQIDTVGANATSYSDVSVCENITYRYRVRANNGVTWDSGYSNEDETATNAKAAPTVLSATRISEVQINLSWTDNSNDETGFKIERCSGAGCSDFSEITTVGSNVTTYNNTGLTYSTDYTYRVRAYKTVSCSWDSVYSNEDSATTSIAAPGSMSATTVNTTQVNLSWTDNTASETGFKIERCEGSGCSGFAQIDTVGANTTSYSDVSVCNTTEYRYRVRANKNTDWDSSYSNEDNAITSSLTDPDSLTVNTVSYTQIDLSWADNMSEETGFKVERCAGSGCSDFSEIATPAANATSYNDTTVSPSTVYCYRVRTYKTASCSWDSGYSSTVCDSSLPSTPTLLTATAVNAFKIQLDWTDNATDEDGYEIEVQIWGGDYVKIENIAADSSTYTDTQTLEPGKEYKYRIRAYRGTDKSPYSNEDTATTDAFTEGDDTCVP